MKELAIGFVLFCLIILSAFCVEVVDRHKELDKENK